MGNSPSCCCAACRPGHPAAEAEADLSRVQASAWPLALTQGTRRRCAGPEKAPAKVLIAPSVASGWPRPYAAFAVDQDLWTVSRFRRSTVFFFFFFFFLFFFFDLLTRLAVPLLTLAEFQCNHTGALAAVPVRKVPKRYFQQCHAQGPDLHGAKWFEIIRRIGEEDEERAIQSRIRQSPLASAGRNAQRSVFPQ